MRLARFVEPRLVVQVRYTEMTDEGRLRHPAYLGVREDKSALADLPTKAELNAYDVVILGDVNPNPRDNPKLVAFMKALAEFVSDRGGGLLMVAGERYAPHAYKNSPLADVLPIDVVSDQPPAEPGDPALENSRRVVEDALRREKELQEELERRLFRRNQPDED